VRCPARTLVRYDPRRRGRRCTCIPRYFMSSPWSRRGPSLLMMTQPCCGVEPPGDEAMQLRSRQLFGESGVRFMRRRPRSAVANRVLVDGVTELRQLAGDSPPAPKRILARHLLDEAHQLRRQGRPTHGARPPRPPPSEAPPMPCDHGRRIDDREALRPPRPRTGDRDPKRAVDRPEPRPRSCPTKNRELLAEHEVLRNEAAARSAACR